MGAATRYRTLRPAGSIYPAAQTCIQAPVVERCGHVPPDIADHSARSASRICAQTTAVQVSTHPCCRAHEAVATSGTRPCNRSWSLRTSDLSGLRGASVYHRATQQIPAGHRFPANQQILYRHVVPLRGPQGLTPSLAEERLDAVSGSARRLLAHPCRGGSSQVLDLQHRRPHFTVCSSGKNLFDGLMTMSIFRGFLASRVAPAVTGGLIVLLLALVALLAGDLAALRAEVAPFQGKNTSIVEYAELIAISHGSFAAAAALDVWTSHGQEAILFSHKKIELPDHNPSWHRQSEGAFWSTKQPEGTQARDIGSDFLLHNHSALAESISTTGLSKNLLFSDMHVAVSMLLSSTDAQLLLSMRHGVLLSARDIGSAAFAYFFWPATRIHFKFANSSWPTFQAALGFSPNSQLLSLYAAPPWMSRSASFNPFSLWDEAIGSFATKDAFFSAQNFSGKASPYLGKSPPARTRNSYTMEQHTIQTCVRHGTWFHLSSQLGIIFSSCPVAPWPS